MSTANEVKLRQIARDTARELITSGNGQIADRLVLTTEGGFDMGGWSEGPLADRILEALRKATQADTWVDRVRLAIGLAKPAEPFDPDSVFRQVMYLTEEVELLRKLEKLTQLLSFVGGAVIVRNSERMLRAQVNSSWWQWLVAVSRELKDLRARRPA